MKTILKWIRGILRERRYRKQRKIIFEMITDWANKRGAYK